MDDKDERDIIVEKYRKGRDKVSYFTNVLY